MHPEPDAVGARAVVQLLRAEGGADFVCDSTADRTHPNQWIQEGIYREPSLKGKAQYS